MESEEFKSQLTELGSIITDGIAYFSAWVAITNLDESSAQALSRYRGLFRPAQLSLQYMALLQFAKVFDHGHRPVSLHNLLAAVKENPKLLTPHAKWNDLQSIEHKINGHEELLEHLKAFRDQRLAHYDSDISRDTSLTFGQVKQLVEDVKDIYNSLSRGHERSVTSFDRISRDAEQHTTEVIRIMCEERDRVNSKQTLGRGMGMDEGDPFANVSTEKVMSTAELLALKEKYQNNTGIAAIVDGILEGRTKTKRPTSSL
ncbi:hypothetical protein ACFLUJ_04285 [Chloroflexota bacterium]